MSNVNLPLWLIINADSPSHACYRFSHEPDLAWKLSRALQNSESNNEKEHESNEFEAKLINIRRHPKLQFNS